MFSTSSLNFVNNSFVNHEQWSKWVHNHHYGNIFQTPEYFKVNKSTKNCFPFCYILTNSNNAILGLASGVIIKNYFAPFAWFTSRAIIQGGPLFAEGIDNDHKVYFLKELVRVLKQKAIYVQIRNMWDVTCEEAIYAEVGFKYERHLDIRNNLLPGKNEVINRISKNKRRNITKTENKGTTFVELKGLNEIKNTFSLIRSTYKRVGLPLVDNSHFVAAYNILYPENLRFFAAVSNDNIIGVRFELIYKDLIYDWYAGSSENEKNKYPNDFLPYNILLWGCDNGYATFDFGGAGKPDKPYGVREHKLKFGGDLVEYGRYEYILNAKIYNFMVKIYKLYRYIKNERDN